MADWQERKLVGDAHEKRVSEELRARGWDVARWGQGVLSPAICAAISRSGSPWRYFPDLVATRSDDLVTIDCKDRMPSRPSLRYSIKRDCVWFGLQFSAVFKIPLFYVFGNLGVLTPTEIHAYPTPGTPTPTGAYFIINGTRAHRFDDVFGIRTYATTAS